MIRILFSFVYTVIFSFQSPAQNTTAVSQPPLLEEKNLQEIFKKNTSVGALLRLMKATTPSQDIEAIRKVVASVGLSEMYVLQDLEIKGTQVGISEGDLFLNLAGITQGLISMGGFNYSRKAFPNEFERFKGLVQFVAFKNRSYTGLERLILPSAFAEKSYSDWLKEKGLKTTAYLLAVTSWTSIFGAMWLVFEGVSLGSAALSGGVVVAAGVVLALAIESLYKAGQRYEDDVAIVCVKGNLRLKSKNTETKLDSGSVGLAELKFREVLCRTPEALSKYNQLLKKVLDPSGASSYIAPARK